MPIFMLAPTRRTARRIRKHVLDLSMIGTRTPRKKPPAVPQASSGRRTRIA
jgi:hypothetical protein